MKSNLAKESIWWLLAALLMVVLPHAPRVPTLVTAFFLIVVTWRYFIAKNNWMLPPRWVRLVLGIAGLGFVYSAYHTIVGRDAGIALLIAMLAIKLLEISNQRDAYVSVLIAYFLVVTHFLYSQSLFTAAYMIAVVIVITAALVDLNRVHHRGQEIVINNLRFALVVLTQAIPFMLILFILFPRVSSPLWGLPDDAYGGSTGLSEEMDPGSISELSLSENVAFRATFEGKPPVSDFLYWRGPVFWYTDGRQWRPSPVKGAAPAFVMEPDYVSHGALTRYSVTLEPHQKRWLFTLDLPAVLPNDSQLTSDYQVRALRDIKQRVRYDAASYLNYRTGELDEVSKRRALQLPRGINRRTLALAQQWRTELRDDGKILAAAMQMFGQQAFIYTLSPPPLNSLDPIDQFLFETRQGFCEHFASSFVTLMRAAGIPARVITGYQGGELNTIGNYLIVRQRDAHAWAEVWLTDQGWLRVDPTAAVAPERVRQSIQANAARLGEAVRFEGAAADWIGKALRDLRFSWDSVNNGWNQWVLNYNQAQQNKFLRDLDVGIDSWQDMVVALSIGVGALLALMAVVVLLHKQSQQDPVQRAWNRFCAKLARRGLARSPAEGPTDFAQRVAQNRPELGEAVKNICDLYVALRYGSGNDEHNMKLKELRNTVRKFSA